MNTDLTVVSGRARKARLAQRLGERAPRFALGLSGLVLVLSLAALAAGQRSAGLHGLGLGTLVACLWLWLKYDVYDLVAARPATGQPLAQSLEARLLARLTPPLTPQGLWQAAAKDWEGSFMLIRLGLQPDAVLPLLSANPLDTDGVWREAYRLSGDYGAASIHAGVVITALLVSEPKLIPVLTQARLGLSDVEAVLDWLERLLTLTRYQRPTYGGIGRDWAAGFTPTLDHFGANLSHEIQLGGHQFGSLAESPAVNAAVTALGAGSAGVVLVGPAGSGKSSMVNALAQRLIEGGGGALAYRQVHSLNASLIMSSSHDPGDLERVFLTILHEAIAAQNVLLALDEAQLFFGHGTGAVDLGQILLPLIEGRRLPLLLTLTPSDWQRLIAQYPSLAAALTPVILNEPDQAAVIQILADTSLSLEIRHTTINRYEALVEAYRLSGRYLTEQAYPGRAIKLLELAQTHPQGNLVTAQSVQAAIEGNLGVKVAQAQGGDNTLLLNLEDRIHERMINQTRAVSVVASALRRARAGVASPRRPLGSFLFLGPTGVGKTELARSLAATYYGGETALVRLDMSEYAQPDDVARLLAVDNPFLGQLRQQPFSVVLLDEIEKAHPNLLNLMLQLLDEGNLTDTSGRRVSFKDAIIIATSNAGAEEIRTRIAAGENLESFEQSFTDNLINSGAFKPELLNRFDEIVLFRPLNELELGQVVALQINELNQTLANQRIAVSLTDAAVKLLVTQGFDPRLGARPMRRMVQRRVQDAVADRILRGAATAGDTITLDAADVDSPLLNTTSGPSQV